MKSNWIQWILVYVFWIITAGLGFLCLISARDLSLLFLSLLKVSSWSASTIDKMTFLILGILWLVLVIFAEYYYREAVPKNVLWKHFSLIMTIELFFLSGSHFAPLLVVVKSVVYAPSFLLPAIEFAGGAAFFEQYKFSSTRKKDTHRA